MNKKTFFLALFALLLMGASAFARLGPRQREHYRPYLVRAGLLASLALVSGAALFITVRLKRARARAERQRRIDEAVAQGETWLLLRPKEARPVEIEQIRLWQRLAYTQPAEEHFSFEIFGNSQGQGLALRASSNKARAVLGEFFQEWPDLQRRPAGEADPARVPPDWPTYWLEVGPQSSDRPVVPASREPLLGVLAEIAGLTAPARALVQVIARPDGAARSRLGRMSLSMRGSDSPSAAVRYHNTRQAKLLEARGERAFLQAVIRVAASAPTPAEAHRAAAGLAQVVCNQFGPDNPVVVLRRSGPRKTVDLAARPISGGARCSWADDEIAALAHLPGGEALQYAPLLSTGSAKSLPAKPELRIPQEARLARYEIE